MTGLETTEGVGAAVVELVRLLRANDRTDLAERATAAGARLKRPSTIVCVVGEFKQGKSSLVNGLLGQTVCPVDDDLATSAITLVRHGDEPTAVVRRRVDNEAIAEQIEIAELHDWVSEVGNPKNHKGVERVDITLPSAMLKQGLVIVDTPGMGGLGAGHAAATLAFLPFADGLIMVSDASAELSAPEVDFLRRAAELCPTVLFAQTKVDLYPAWERIFDLNRGHLEQNAIDLPMVAVSSQLRTQALGRKDRELNVRSKFPELITALGEKVVEPAKLSAAARSAGDVRGIVGMVRAGLHDEQELLDDPSRVQAAIEEINQAKERLEHLRGPGARWSVVVNDRISDLSTSITHGFRGQMRTISRTMDERIESLTKGSEWDDLSRDLQTEVADAVTQVFVDIASGRASIHREAAELIEEEHLALPSAAGRSADPIDVHELWQGKSSLEDGKAAGRAFKTGLTGVRGAQGGVMMFGMMGQFLPAAAAALVATNPVLIGAGAVFGSVQLLDDRKRKVTMRRQTARQQVRQFIDDVQFEVGNEINGLMREAQRELRDEFTERLKELQRTYTETAQRAQADAKRTQEEVASRRSHVEDSLARLDAIELMLNGGGAS